MFLVFVGFYPIGLSIIKITSNIAILNLIRFFYCFYCFDSLYLLLVSNVKVLCISSNICNLWYFIRFLCLSLRHNLKYFLL